MSTWVSAAPVIGASSLDGFAIGALMTGACALAITAPRRTRGRKAPPAREGALAAEEGGWLCEHVMAAEAFWTEITAEAAVVAGSAASPPGLPSGTMTGALPSEAVVPELVAAAMAPGIVAEAVACALAVAPVGPVQTAGAADLTLAAPASAAGAFEASAERLAPPEESGALARRRGAARAAGSYHSRHRLGDPTLGSMPRDGAELVFPDPLPSDGTLDSPRRTEARRMPRHAAPSVSFGSRITGFSGRMTGLFAPRALATGARG